MRQKWLKGLGVAVLIAACVFCFAAGYTLTAQQAQANYCSCYLCEYCHMGMYIDGQCTLNELCPRAECCAAPQIGPLIP